MYLLSAGGFDADTVNEFDRSIADDISSAVRTIQSIGGCVNTREMERLLQAMSPRRSIVIFQPNRK